MNPQPLKSAVLADDEPHVRTFLKLVLRQVGIESIHEASNGLEAFEAFRSHRPLLTLLDVNMPKADGVEALRRIRQIAPEALVVMLTSLASDDIVEDCLEAGADFYLRKDTPPAEIVNQLRNLLSEAVWTS